jgi:hypothetical protein
MASDQTKVVSGRPVGIDQDIKLDRKGGAALRPFYTQKFSADREAISHGWGDIWDLSCKVVFFG